MPQNASGMARQQHDIILQQFYGNIENAPITYYAYISFSDFSSNEGSTSKGLALAKISLERSSVCIIGTI